LVAEVLDFFLFVKQRQQAKATSSNSSELQAGILDLLQQVADIQAQVPPEEWDKLPHDGSINHDRYLY
jgi:hypothetical protein